MRKLREETLLNAIYMGPAGSVLLAIVLLAPDAGQPVGKSFFRIALDSSWRNLADLPAAWCSLKILLLSVSAIMLSDSLSKTMEAFHQETLAVTASFAALLPILGVPFGLFELLKALL